MADEIAKVRRTLLLRLKAPTPDAAKVLGSMMRNTAAIYNAFGDAKVRFLRNADDQTQFFQIIEFQADQAVERSRQKMASDPTMQNFLQAWRSMFPGAADAEVYEDVGEYGQCRLKHWISRSCSCAARFELKVPRLRRLPVRGSFLRE